MSAIGIGLSAAAVALLAMLLAIGAARLARRRRREVERDAWWVLQVADTINADVRHAAEQAASAPDSDLVFDVIERLLLLDREANGLCARPREVLAALPSATLVRGWKEARELRGIVLRLVLVRTQADMALRALGELLTRGHASSGLATLL